MSTTTSQTRGTLYVLQQALLLTRRRWRLIAWSSLALMCLVTIPLLLVLAIITGFAHALPPGAAVTPPGLGGWLLALSRIAHAAQQGTLGAPLMGMFMVSAGLVVALVAFFDAGLYGALADDLAGPEHPSVVAQARHHFARMLSYTITRLALLSSCAIFAVTVMIPPLSQETALTLGQCLWTALGMSAVALTWLLCTLWRMSALADVVFANATAGEALRRAWSRLATRLGDLLRLTVALTILFTPFVMALITTSLLGIWLDQQPTLKSLAVGVHLMVELMALFGLAAAHVVIGAAFLVEHRIHLGPLEHPLARQRRVHVQDVALGHALLPADPNDGLALTLMPQVNTTPNIFRLSDHLGTRTPPIHQDEAHAPSITTSDLATSAPQNEEMNERDQGVDGAPGEGGAVVLEVADHPFEDDGFDGWLSAASDLDVLEELSITVDEVEAPAEEVELLDVEARDENLPEE